MTQESVAARLRREHQRTPTPVPTPDPRLPDPNPSRLRHLRRQAQWTPSTDPRLQDTITGIGRRCDDGRGRTAFRSHAHADERAMLGCCRRLTCDAQRRPRPPQPTVASRSRPRRSRGSPERAIACVRSGWSTAPSGQLKFRTGGPPAGCVHVSVPSPPSIRVRPMPPSSWSSPSLPKRWSLPPRPRMMSARSRRSDHLLRADGCRAGRRGSRPHHRSPTRSPRESGRSGHWASCAPGRPQSPDPGEDHPHRRQDRIGVELELDRVRPPAPVHPVVAGTGEEDLGSPGTGDVVIAARCPLSTLKTRFRPNLRAAVATPAARLILIGTEESLSSRKRPPGRRGRGRHRAGRCPRPQPASPARAGRASRRSRVRPPAGRRPAHRPRRDPQVAEHPRKPQRVVAAGATEQPVIPGLSEHGVPTGPAEHDVSPGPATEPVSTTVAEDAVVAGSSEHELFDGELLDVQAQPVGASV